MDHRRHRSDDSTYIVAIDVVLLHVLSTSTFPSDFSIDLRSNQAVWPLVIYSRLIVRGTYARNCTLGWASSRNKRGNFIWELRWCSSSTGHEGEEGNKAETHGCKSRLIPRRCCVFVQEYFSVLRGVVSCKKTISSVH